jgi:hypothetical protein
VPEAVYPIVDQFDVTVPTDGFVYDELKVTLLLYERNRPLQGAAAVMSPPTGYPARSTACPG